MTSLLSLDIRGNNFFAEYVPNGIFKYLTNLNALKIRGWDFSLETSKQFVEETRFFKSLESFVFDRGDLKLITLFTSQYINLTSLAITSCSHNNLPLSLFLRWLGNLTKLNSITIYGSWWPIVGNYTLDWSSNIRNVNFACNSWDPIEIIRFLGSQNSFSQLDTLILDGNDNHDRNDIDTYFLGANLFCNLTFSNSLRRWSLQRTGPFVFDAALTKCLPNLRSVSIGHNVFFNVFYNGRHVIFEDRSTALVRSLTSLYHLKASYVMASSVTPEIHCDNIDDVTFDLYFVNEMDFVSNSTTCEQGLFDRHYRYFVLPSCLRSIQFDHFVLNLELNYVPPFHLKFSPNNSLELIDLSYSMFLVDGYYLNGITVSGLHELRVLKLKHVNGRRLYMTNLHDLANLREIGVSENNLEEMTGKQLSAMFTSPLPIRKLDLSSCNIRELNADFLYQFPCITYLDLSRNKLSHLSLNLSWLTSNESITMDLSANQISTVDISFLGSIQQMKKHQPITLKLGDNRFRCDCDTVDFLRWFQMVSRSCSNVGLYIVLFDI